MINPDTPNYAAWLDEINKRLETDNALSTQPELLEDIAQQTEKLLHEVCSLNLLQEHTLRNSFHKTVEKVRWHQTNHSKVYQIAGRCFGLIGVLDRAKGCHARYCSVIDQAIQEVRKEFPDKEIYITTYDPKRKINPNEICIQVAFCHQQVSNPVHYEDLVFYDIYMNDEGKLKEQSIRVFDKEAIKEQIRQFCDPYLAHLKKLKQYFPELTSIEPKSRGEFNEDVKYIAVPSKRDETPGVTLHYLDGNDALQSTHLLEDFDFQQVLKSEEKYIEVCSHIRKLKKVYPDVSIRFGKPSEGHQKGIVITRVLPTLKNNQEKYEYSYIGKYGFITGEFYDVEVLASICNEVKEEMLLRVIPDQFRPFSFIHYRDDPVTFRKDWSHFSLKYDPAEGYSVDHLTKRFPINGTTLDELKAAAIKLALNVRQDFEELFSSHYGDENIIKFGKSIAYKKDAFSIREGTNGKIELHFVNWKLEKVKNEYFVEDLPSKAIINKLLMSHRLIREYAEKPDAIPFLYSDNSLTDHSEGIVVTSLKDFNGFQFSYKDPLTKKPITYAVPLNQFIIRLEECYRTYQAALLMTELEPSPEVRAKTKTPTEVPSFLPEGEAVLLIKLFEKINFIDPLDPSYRDPKKLEEQGIFFTPAQLLENLAKLIRIVSEKGDFKADLQKGHYYGIPDTPAEREKYYAQLKAYLSQIIILLQKPDLDAGIRNEIVISLAIGAKHCGGRWIGEAMLHYNALAGKAGDNLNEFFMGFADLMKISIIEKMDRDGNAPNTHKYLALCKVLSQTAGLGIPAAAGANYNDPYSRNALYGSPYYDQNEERQLEKILQGFMAKFNGYDFVSFILEQSNAQLHGSNKFAGMLQEMVHDMVNERLERDPQTKIKFAEIDKRLENRQKEIHASRELDVQTIEEKISKAPWLIKEMNFVLIEGSEFEKKQAEFLNAAITRWKKAQSINIKTPDTMEAENTKDWEIIMKTYTEQMKTYKKELLDLAGNERRGKMQELIAAETEKYLTFNENGILSRVNQTCVVDLLKHMGLVVNRV